MADQPKPGAPEAPKLHQLDAGDLSRMNVPEEFWPRTASGWDGLTPSVRAVAFNYVKDFEEMCRLGRGLLLLGLSGRGKTSTAVLLLKEARRRFRTGFFVRAGELRYALSDEHNFDADTSVWDRCRTVDFLVIDAFGEPDLSAPWFNLDRLIDLAGERGERHRPTLVTSDLKMANLIKKRPDFVSKVGTWLVPIEVEGDDRRESEREAALKRLTRAPESEPKQLEQKNPESKAKKGGK